MRRPLLEIAALFALGCLVVDGLGTPHEVLRVLGLVALCLGLAVRASGQRAARWALAAAAFGLGVGAAGVEALSLEAGSLRRALTQGTIDGRPRRLEGVVRGDALPRLGRLALVLDADALDEDGGAGPVAGRVRIEVGGQADKPRLLDGDRIAIWAALRRAEGRDEGLAAFGYCKSARLVERLPADGRARLRRLVSRARERARRVFEETLPAGTERGLVRAMVLGDRAEIDEPTAEAFKASGTYHVLALSGAQVALLASLLAGLLRWLRAGPWLLGGLTTLAISGYAVFVGGDVPIARAALMAGAVLLGRALEADADPRNLLGMAAIALVLARPSSAADVGFQLSFGATLGILALTPQLTRGLSRWPLRLDLALAASVAAQAALFPLLAAHFHRLAPAAVLLNLAAVPLSAAVLLGGVALLALAPFGAGWLAAPPTWLAARALRMSGDLGPAADWFDLRIAAPSLGLLALYAAGLGLVLRGRRRGGLLLLVAAHLALALGPLAPAADGRLRLTVIDVGQGDALLLQSPAGRAMVVDAGGAWDGRFDAGERRVSPVLWRRGIRRVDALVVSHAHPDHVGGVPFLLKAFRIGAAWEGPAPLGDPAWQRLDGALEAARVPRLTLFRGAVHEWGGATISVLGPRSPARPPARVRNEDSVVLEVRFGAVRFVLTGDVTQNAEDDLALGPAVAVKVAHHGSRTSSGARLRRATSPRIAIVSAGARNPFGHPDPAVIGSWRSEGALVLRTDRDGNVSVATDGERVWVATSKEALERRIR